MTIQGFNGRWDYIGDNIVTSFPFDNLVIKDTDLRVYLDNVLQTITVDYTVTGAGTDAGSVDFLIAPAAAVAVAIVRKTARDQLTAYPTNGPFPAKSHEAAIDKLTVIVQEDEEDHNKLIQYHESSLVEGMPIADPVANAILAYAPDGLSLINGPSVQDIFASEAAAAASAAAAAVSEAEAAVSAAAALASEGNASASEIAAAASEAAAAVSAAAALASEAAAALSASQLSGTSVTAVAIGVGAKVFETQAGKFFDAGTFLLVFSDADPTQYMAGQVANYVGTTLTLNVTQFEGAGSPADWTIQVSGKFGVDGAQAPRTVVIVTADLDISAGFTHNTFFQVRPVAEALVTITIPDATTAGFIDGYEGTFHLDLAGSILVDTPSSPPVTEIDGLADLVIADPGSAVTLIASTTTSNWQISQDDRPKEATGITIFPTTSADPIIAGYNAGVTDNDDVRYDDPSVTITTPVLTNSALDRATAEQLFAFITDAGVITDLLDNDLIVTVVLNKTPSNAKDLRVFLSLFVRNSGGVETLIKETATSSLITGAPTEQNLIFSNVTADITATDRIVVKSFGFKDVAGGTNPAAQSTLGGKLPSDTPARLKIPQSLASVSHNATTGLQGGGAGEFYHLTAAEYAALAFNNLIINGDMKIAQRGISFVSPANGDWLMDRWQWNGTSAAAVVTITRDTDTPTIAEAGVKFTHSLKVDVTTGELTATGFSALATKIEGNDMAFLGYGAANAKTVTVSFWVKATIIGTHTCVLRNNATDRSYPASFLVEVADTWEYKTITITGSLDGTWETGTGKGIHFFITLAIDIAAVGSGDAWVVGSRLAITGQANQLSTAANNFYITGVKIEPGEEAKAFPQEDYGTTLAKCQRYLPAFNSGGASDPICNGFAENTTLGRVIYPLMVEPRVTPTGITVGSAVTDFRVRAAAGVITLSGLSFFSGSLISVHMNFSVAAGLTSGQGLQIETVNANAQILFTGCEL